MIVEAAALEDLTARALQNAGARPGMAAAAARVLVKAESLGVQSHGVARVPFYCSMLRGGRADGSVVPRPLRQHEAVYLLDNADALVFEA
ncbi:MAG: Ldh family oxidoreductase, partial [Pseudomonadota bacterium]